MLPRGVLLSLICVLSWIAAAAFPIDQHPHQKSYQNVDQNLFQRNEGESWNKTENGEIISVRITSSVAVERGRQRNEHLEKRILKHRPRSRQSTERTTRHADEDTRGSAHAVSASEKHSITVLPPDLSGANLEYLKQLRSKMQSNPRNRPFPFHLSQSSQNSTQEETLNSAIREDAEASNIEVDVPRARSIPLSSGQNSLHEHHPTVNITRNYGTNSTATRVSFNIVHETPNVPYVYSEPAKIYSEPSKVYSEPAKVYGKPEIFYSEPSKVYGEPSKVYSEPAKVYGKPELFYSEPAKVYGEPSKVYSEPAKVYSEPAKIYSKPAEVYSEPAKFYSEPAYLHQTNNAKSLELTTTSSSISNTTENTELDTPVTVINTSIIPNMGTLEEHKPEQNHDDVEKTWNVETNRRAHQASTQTEAEERSSEKDNKVGYVVEGQQFRKYRVEERTPDGFIVGEYGVVSNNDGSLRGVRYTADGDTNPRLIYDALVKFLHLT